MADLATITDVSGRWPGYSPTQHAGPAAVRLGDASAIVRLAIPDIDTRIAADTTGALARATAAAVADAVIRVLDNPDGAKRVQETIGDRAYTLDYGDNVRSGLFITVDEMAPLQPGGGGQGYAIGTAIVQTRPGWDPRRARSYGSAGWWPTS